MTGLDVRRCEGAAIFTRAFRPFFLAASLWSALALALWIGMLFGGISLPIRFDPLTWHIHEMLFGFIPAAMGGFILTAIPTWTGRPPLQGAPLAALAALWLFGRLTCLFSALVPLWFAAAVDVAFLAVLSTIAVTELTAGGNRRNLPIPISIAVLAGADLIMYLEHAGWAVPAGLGWRLGLSAIVILISVIGTKIIPTFTRNWLLARGCPKVPTAHLLLDRAALGALHTGLIGWAFAPRFTPIGALLLLAAALNLLRLARWRGSATLTAPLLVILHLGYLWLIVGATLLGASMLSATIPQAAAIHAFTAGAMGTMILAVMTRVTLGHTGRPLEADRFTTLIYLMINIAALMRIAASGGARTPLLELSAALWVGSFALFAVHYGPMLVAPRIQREG